MGYKLKFSDIIYILTGRDCLNTFDPREYLSITLNEISESSDEITQLRKFLCECVDIYEPAEENGEVFFAPSLGEEVPYKVIKMTQAIQRASEKELSNFLESLKKQMAEYETNVWCLNLKASHVEQFVSEL